MPSKSLANATNLALWANRVDAESILPRLIRRLIHATLQPPFEASFRADEGTRLPGWDGWVVCRQGNAFVPDGPSGWEVSTRRDIGTKASEDYRSRKEGSSARPPVEVGYMAVTLRRWRNKAQWASDREREGHWRTVRALDADDLEQWLELAPAVHRWVSVQIGKRPEQADDLETYWADWAESTQEAISPEFVLAGRGETASRIATWLDGTEPTLVLRSESRSESLAIFAATISTLQPERRLAWFSTALVVHNETAWSTLTDCAAPLMLIPRFGATEVQVTKAIRKGHRVALLVGRSDPEGPGEISAAPLDAQRASALLKDRGVPDEKARSLARLARNSLLSFRRQLSVHRQVQKPAWAETTAAIDLVPVFLAGAWNDQSAGDREALAGLAGKPYEAVDGIVSRWTLEEDPPMRRIGSVWVVNSRVDFLELVGRCIQPPDLSRFEETVRTVLGAIDPRYDLSDNERYMAGMMGQVPRQSEQLRKGLAETLAILANGPNAEVPRRIVRDLLHQANTDWRRWASLSSYLPLLAEAAPEEFLAAVGEGVRGDGPVLVELYRDKGSSIFGASSPHTELLWALETLAWFPQHLAQCALALAALSRLDPGGNLGNRPAASLRSLFRLWHAETCAPFAQQLEVLDLVLSREPKTGWRLLVDLIPGNHDTAMNNPRPSWRPMPGEPSHPKWNREIREHALEVIAKVLAHVADDEHRWKDLVQVLDSIDPESLERALVLLEGIDPERLSQDARNELWATLRDELSRHRSYPDAGWAMREEVLVRLERIYSRLEPRDLGSRYGWLFSSRPNLPDGREHDREDVDATVLALQEEAIRVVMETGNVPAVIEFAKQVERPNLAGYALGRLDHDIDTQILGNLGPGSTPEERLAYGFVLGRNAVRERTWAEERTSDPAWSPRQRACFLLSLKLDDKTWELLAGCDPATVEEYWRAFWPWGVRLEDVGRAIRALLGVGRPYAALNVLSSHRRDDAPLDSELSTTVLEAIMTADPEADLDIGHAAWQIGETLGLLRNASDVDETRLARLEWAFMPLLEHGRHGTPEVLHRELGRNPEFFVEIFSLVFPPENETPEEVTDEARRKARNGYHLLTSWRTVPGTGSDGTIDADVLASWIERARAMLQGTGRGALGDEQIGEILSGSPRGVDGDWPHEAVRDVIERVASDDLERGISIGRYNSRGVVVKNPDEGGGQERGIAAQLDEMATKLLDRWPRTAALLRRMADSYRRDGRREDDDAELREEDWS